MVLAWLVFLPLEKKKWDLRFHPVMRDLNKSFSSKTSFFSHLSPLRGFICLVICNRARCMIGAMDKGSDWAEGGQADVWTAGCFRFVWRLFRGNEATGLTQKVMNGQIGFDLSLWMYHQLKIDIFREKGCFWKKKKKRLLWQRWVCVSVCYIKPGY